MRFLLKDRPTLMVGKKMDLTKPTFMADYWSLSLFFELLHNITGFRKLFSALMCRKYYFLKQNMEIPYYLKILLNNQMTKSFSNSRLSCAAGWSFEYIAAFVMETSDSKPRSGTKFPIRFFDCRQEDMVKIVRMFEEASNSDVID